MHRRVFLALTCPQVNRAGLGPKPIEPLQFRLVFYPFFVLPAGSSRLLGRVIQNRRDISSIRPKKLGRIQRERIGRCDRLKPLFIDESPVVNPPKIPERIQWVRPTLVCEIAFAEWTEDGELRQTAFLGWRDDKDPEEVVYNKRRNTDKRAE